MKNWIEKAVEVCDPHADLIVLENPATKEFYDQILKTIWLPVRERLKKTGYIYTPEIEPQIESEGKNIVSRKMTWMLHELSRAKYRGSVEINRMHWMVENEFFLCLDSHIDFRFVTELIGNSRMAGNPPELTIHKHHTNDFEGYYQVTYLNGTGESFYPGCEERIIHRIKKCIDVNVEMNEITIDNDWNEKRVAEFLTVAFEVYEGY
jgi:hypothetical protein